VEHFLWGTVERVSQCPAVLFHCAPMDLQAAAVLFLHISTGSSPVLMAIWSIVFL